MKRSDINPMPAFFDCYIKIVPDFDIFEAFEKYTPDQVFAETEKLVALEDKVYAPGKWTVRDIIQHVTDNERIMAYRALRFSRNDQTVLAGYDEDLLGANTIANERSFFDLMQEFNEVRAATISLYRGMNEEMMQRTGVANGASISPLALGFVILGHPVHHMHVIRERYFPIL